MNNKIVELRNQLSDKAKNGIDFTLAASILWLAIAYVWTLQLPPYTKSILVFIVGSPLLPIAFLFSKLFKTTWKIENNPLQTMGLWLNFAQLIYFPFLIFTMLKTPEYFIMSYAIITGAHLFPYAWLYKTIWYAIFAVLISIGALIIALTVSDEQMYLLAIFTSISLFTLTICLYFNYKNRIARTSN